MIELCKSLKRLPGVSDVTLSNFHREKIRIHFRIHKDSSNILNLLGRCMSRNYGGFENYNPNWPSNTIEDKDWIIGGGWKITLGYSDMIEPIDNGFIFLCLDSGLYSGQEAIKQSELISDNINSHLEDENFLSMFGITNTIRNEKLKILLD